MRRDLEGAAWPLEKGGEALEALVERTGLSRARVSAPSIPHSASRGDGIELSRWILSCAQYLGAEAEALDLTDRDLAVQLREASPALVFLPRQQRFLAIITTRRRRIVALGPDLEIHEAAMEDVCRTLREPLESPWRDEIDRVLAAAGLPEHKRARVRHALLRERLAGRQVGVGWRFGLAPGAPFFQHVRRAGVVSVAGAFLGAHLVQYFVLLLSWWTVGRAVLSGHFDRGWLLAWGLLLATLVPLRIAALSAQGRLAITVGGLLKKRLIHGALRLESEETRHQGVGQLMGRVLESEAVETLALSGGIMSLVSILELCFAAVILRLGAGGLPHVATLGVWTVVALLIALRYERLRRRWTGERLRLTEDVVEGLVGHRTRLVQEPRDGWHEQEDRALSRYLVESRRMDRVGTLLVALVPHAWPVIGVVGMASAVVSGAASRDALAVSVGGLVLAYGAFNKLGAGLWSIVGALIAWRQVAPVFRAASRPLPAGSPEFAVSTDDEAAPDVPAPILEAHHLIFRYQTQPDAVLKGCSLEIHPGDRLLLEGSSGSGKSTLVSLLAGLRRPERGVLLAGGLDLQTLGSAGWHRRVAAVPQFHENHVFSETLAFNLLVARRWPPTADDMTDAETICRELGLGELLEKMPAGLLQRVGETGWQLSQGERSRLFIARALLHDADLLILDESFGALDPDTTRVCLRAVQSRARALLVVAHS